MANYNDAQQLLQQLKPIINQCIENHPLVKSAIKVKKAVVMEAPNTTTHTVKIKFPADLFNKDVQPLTFPYNPNISIADLAVNKAVYVFYYQSLSNGVIMQNENWTV